MKIDIHPKFTAHHDIYMIYYLSYTQKQAKHFLILPDPKKSLFLNGLMHWDLLV